MNLFLQKDISRNYYFFIGKHHSAYCWETIPVSKNKLLALEISKGLESECITFVWNVPWVLFLDFKKEPLKTKNIMGKKVYISLLALRFSP